MHPRLSWGNAVSGWVDFTACNKRMPSQLRDVIETPVKRSGMRKKDQPFAVVREVCYGTLLYPTKPGPDDTLEPEAIPSKCIPPSWNQFVFFEVQPGKSFHSVEEVVVGEGEDSRERLSISGWFHAAQAGEEGYVEEPHPPELKSSRDQLVSCSPL